MNRGPSTSLLIMSVQKTRRKVHATMFSLFLCIELALTPLISSKPYCSLPFQTAFPNVCSDVPSQMTFLKPLCTPQPEGSPVNSGSQVDSPDHSPPSPLTCLFCLSIPIMSCTSDLLPCFSSTISSPHPGQ